VLTWRRRRRGPAPVAPDPAAESRLAARIGEVAKRERALARRAGQLVVRGQVLEP
jgi:hypothetical protein